MNDKVKSIEENKKETSLRKVISELLIKLARRIPGDSVESNINLNSSVTLLNSALGLVDADQRRARQIVSQVRRISNIRD